MSSRGGKWPSPIATRRVRRWQRRVRSNQLPQTLHSHWLAAIERLAITRADALAPIRRLVAQAVEEGGGVGGAAGDELALVASDGGELLFPVAADVEDECRLGGVLQVDAVVVED